MEDAYSRSVGPTGEPDQMAGHFGLVGIIAAMTMPAAGDPAPDFTLPDQDGHPVSLKDLRGQNVVVYFYPKADTPATK